MYRPRTQVILVECRIVKLPVNSAYYLDFLDFLRSDSQPPQRSPPFPFGHHAAPRKDAEKKVANSR
jgi:hypothetical protein